MKKKYILLLAALTTGVLQQATAQTLQNDGLLSVKPGAELYVTGGGMVNSSTADLENDGTVTLTGDLTNNQTMSTYYAGTLAFIGIAAQIHNGSSPYWAYNVLVNNAAGLTLNNKLKADGTVTFASGIVTAASTAAPLWFTGNGTYTGVADATHVNGYVVKEGTGSFTYPVGDGTRYEKVDVNPTANAPGIQVKYNGTDAGAGPFTTTGTEATPLIAYNTLEHWDITPLSTATGTVTVYWDNYKNLGITNPGDLKVAHKTGGNWLNEGTTGTGTAANGSVTSNPLSVWSPFTLGSINITSPLPLHLLSFTGSKESGYNQLQWKTTNEVNTMQFEVERSSNNGVFNKIATVTAEDNSDNTYSYDDNKLVDGQLYYRLKMVDNVGRFSYSNIVVLSNDVDSRLGIYPNPATDNIIVSVDKSLLNTEAVISDVRGAELKRIKITQLQNPISLQGLANGVYILKTASGATVRIVKQ